MTRRDFEAIAGVMRSLRPLVDNASAAYITWRGACYTMADTLATTNERFNRERFLHACGC